MAEIRITICTDGMAFHEEFRKGDSDFARLGWELVEVLSELQKQVVENGAPVTSLVPYDSHGKVCGTVEVIE